MGYNKVMKIAVIDHIGNTGGGSRVVRQLIPAIKKVHPSSEVTYFGSRDAILREDLLGYFEKKGIKTKELSSFKIKLNRAVNSDLFQRVRKKFRPNLFKSLFNIVDTISKSALFNLKREIESSIEGFDIAFFPWPFQLECPDSKVPMVGIFHDFNYRYYFSGTHTFSDEYRKVAEAQMPLWLRRCLPIVSSNFIAT